MQLPGWKTAKAAEAMPRGVVEIVESPCPESRHCLVSRILTKVHADRSPQYSSINAVCFFSANLLVSSPNLPMPALFWMPAIRQPADAGLLELLTKLVQSWYECVSRTVGRPIPRIQMAPNSVEELKVIRGNSTA